MPEPTATPLAALASRFADQVWSIRDSALQAYAADLIAGRLRLLEQRTREAAQAYERQGAVAVFRVDGVMVPRARWYDEVSTSDLTAALKSAGRDDEIQAGVLLINSPGGMALGQLELTAAAKAFADAKPLTAHIVGCCCSAAYWLASQAQEVYSGPRDDVGSIGVRSLMYDYSAYFSELGVEAVSPATGPMKDLGVLGKPITDDQRDYLQSRVDYLFEDFKAAVVSGRGFNDEQFAAVADGRVWFGEQALELGLIDGVQSMEQTLAGAESAPTSVSVPKEPTMADNAKTEPAGPQPATLAQLKDLMPEASSDFVLGQLEAQATETEALKAYNAHLAEQNATLASERDQAKADAAKPPAKNEPKASTRGVDLAAGDPTADTDPAPTDYRALARDLAKEKGVSYREACRRVQKQHPEARAAFRHAPLGDQ